MIDIIEAAKADRQSKLDQILILQLDVIEIDQFIARARSYAGQGDIDTTAPNPLPEGEVNPSPDLETPAEAKTVDQEPSTDGSGGVQDECAIHPATSIPAEEISPSPAKTLAGQIAAVHAEHPDWTARVIADHLGKRPPVVRRAAQNNGIDLPAGIPGRRGVAADRPQEARKSPPAHKALAKPEPLPTLPNEPVRNVKRIPPHQPKGTRFRLRNSDGLFLHSDLNAMLRKGLRFVGKSEYPWEGSERQMLAVRQMLPATIDLREEVITNDK